MTNVPQNLDNKSLDKKLAELLAFQRRTISGVVGTGRVLTEIKEQLDHGEFTAWLKQNCGWSHATTLRYRRSFEWANTIDDFENLNLTIMVLYFCAEKHAKASESADEYYGADCKAGLTAVVTVARKRLIDRDEAEGIYLLAFSEEERLRSDAGGIRTVVPAEDDDIEVDETIDDDDDSTFPIDEEEGDVDGTDTNVDVAPRSPHTLIITPDGDGMECDCPPLKYIHQTVAGERTEYLPASPLHFLSALHMMIATHANSLDDDSLREIEARGKVEYHRLVDHLVDLRSKSEAGNSPIKTKADRAEAKARKRPATVKGKLSDIVSNSYDELIQLGEEMREWADNTVEHFSQTEKYQTVEAAADTLENIDMPSVPEALAVIEIEYTPAPNKRTSRANRCAYACYMLTQAKEALDRLIEMPDTREEIKAQVEALGDEIENITTEVGEVEFPGMY
jgi:Protein of unknown function (DUF3102)